MNFRKVAWTITAAILVVLGIWASPALLSDRHLMPHRMCFDFQPPLIWLHAVSDLLIGISYVVISFLLAYLVRRARRLMPFSWVIVAFGLFIVACAGTHFMDVVTLWIPVYWLSGAVKAVTAVASVATAVALPGVIPQLLRVLQDAETSEQRKRHLEQAHEELTVVHQQLERLDQLKTQFFSNVSHELRTPLTLILGPVEQLLKAPQAQAFQPQLTVIQRNAQTLLKHVNDLLDLSKLDAGGLRLEAEPVDAGELLYLVSSHFGLLASERKIDFGVEAENGVLLLGDRNKLERILLNLLGNAFKFTPVGGRIRCSVQPEDTGERRWVRFEVRDSGPGIPPNDRVHIFERFRQLEEGSDRQTGGTGLGLAIVQEFTRLHNGEISVSDAVEGGARFVVRLPAATVEPSAGLKTAPVTTAALQQLARGEVEVLRGQIAKDRQPTVNAAGNAAPAPNTAPAPNAAAGSEKPLVLIAEDHPDMNRFLVETLSSDYRVVSCWNGQDALQSALSVEPDVVVTDLMMPGSSGEHLLAQLRSRASLYSVPVLVLSAKADETVRVRLLREGAQDFLLKPFLADELRARVSNLVSLRLARKHLQRELDSQEQDLERLTLQLLDRRQELEKAVQRERSEARRASENERELARQQREVQRLNAELEERVQQRTAELRVAMQELETFSYSVSHDLRAPLRTISGFTEAVLEDYAGKLDAQAVEWLGMVRSATVQMNQLIDDLLELARVTRAEMRLQEIDVTALAGEVAASLRQSDPDRSAEIVIAPGLKAYGDPRLLRVVLDNLLRNAWKFTRKRPAARIEVTAGQHNGTPVFVVRDNGVGFDMNYAHKLFQPFQRLHSAVEFEGTGIGLATVSRVVKRHGGTAWAESAPGEGASIFFSLAPVPERSLRSEAEASRRV